MKYKDHITLSECTKDDLLWIIKRMSFLDGDYSLKSALNELWYEKENKRIAEAEKQAKFADQKMREYIELISPYAGKPIKDIPYSVVDKADKAMKAAQKARERCAVLMGLKV